MAFKKTTADVPPQAASEFSKASRPEAVAEADGAGYTKTAKLAKAAKPKFVKSSQFGLPKSGARSIVKM